MMRATIPVAASLLALAQGLRDSSIALFEEGGLDPEFDEEFDGDSFVETESEAERASRLNSTYMQHLRYGRKVAVKGTPLLPFPEGNAAICRKIVCSDTEPEHLGAGSFGEAWLATEKGADGVPTGRKVVIKLLYVRDEVEVKHQEDRYTMVFNKKINEEEEVLMHSSYSTFELTPRYLTNADVTPGSEYEKNVKEAKQECRIEQFLHQGSAAPQAAKGAQRIMGCSGHNIGVEGAENEPMYLLLENCGKTDLTKFMSQTVQPEVAKWKAPVVLSLFKQLLEGLAYITSFKTPWIHHDLKPDNLVVKDHGNDVYTLHFIDFGGTVKAKKSNVCDITASTVCFAPSEWFGGTECNRKRGQNFDLKRPDGFDLFAAGAIFLQMITGGFIDEVFDGFRIYAGNGLLNHDFIQRQVADPLADAFIAQLSAVDPNFRDTLAPFKTKGSTEHSFLKKVLGLLKTKPQDRPTAADLLSHAAMTSIETPDDPHYAASEGETDPVSEDEIPDHSAAASDDACPEKLTKLGCKACASTVKSTGYVYCYTDKWLNIVEMNKVFCSRLSTQKRPQDARYVEYKHANWCRK